MTARVLRKIIQIDEEKCNGCGACVTSCVEGALALIDGKARLVKEKYCDGLAACLKECPQGAITIVEREAEDFDEEAAKEHLLEQSRAVESVACACAGSSVRQFVKGESAQNCREGVRQESMLNHWPVQLTLVPARARFLEKADVVLVADCVPFAYPNLHQDFLKDRSVLVACPKLDDFKAHLAKLTDILSKSTLKSLTVLHMEVPCCSGLVNMAREAIKESGRDIPFKELTIGIEGNIESQS
jgi:Pyruvate/2-oxoacid:ferredoxin oxidoreductase delta subunit